MNYIIIVAGGTGSRMGQDIPKQFIEINNLPILMHTINKFYNSIDSKIIVVMNGSYINYWEELCIKYNFTIPHEVIQGGETRFNSVKNGLSLTNSSPDSIIAVHDAVRPLITTEWIKMLFDFTAKNKSAIPVIPVQDSIRRIINGKSESVDRSQYYLVQTPQCFNAELLHKAYNQDYNSLFTDDASVVEQMGESVCIADGLKQNIKITYPEDLIFAINKLKEIK